MDQRQEQRLRTDAEIRFRYPDVFKAKLMDFCAGGLGAEVPFSLEIDSPVEMEIFEGRLLAGGHVRWIEVKDGRVRIGIRFRDEDRSIIEQIKELRGAIN